MRLWRTFSGGGTRETRSLPLLGFHIFPPLIHGYWNLFKFTLNLNNKDLDLHVWYINFILVCINVSAIASLANEKLSIK